MKTLYKKREGFLAVLKIKIAPSAFGSTLPKIGTNHSFLLSNLGSSAVSSDTVDTFVYRLFAMSAQNGFRQNNSREIRKDNSTGFLTVSTKTRLPLI